MYQRTKEFSKVFSVSWRASVVGEKFAPEEIASEIFLDCVDSVDLFLDGTGDEFEEIVFFSSFLGISEKAHHQCLDALGITLCGALLTNAFEESGEVLRLGLKSEKELLV